MHTSSVFLHDIADFLRRELATDQYPTSEQGGIYRPSERPIRRLGLALGPWSDLPNWIAENQIDGMWLHRPWQLDLFTLPETIGVLYHHLPFDETLTMGHNSLLANQIGAIGQIESLGFKQALAETGQWLPQRPIGMVFDVAEQEFDAVLQSVKILFNGYDRAEAGRHMTVGRVAVVGAMNDRLIQEAVDRKASLYLTGQYRKPAQIAVNETGIAVVAVGHLRSEEWGLHALANRLRQQWKEMDVVVQSAAQLRH